MGKKGMEHQSTYSMNMPLRFLDYAVEVLKTFSYKVAKYGSKPLEVPNMLFIVLYNGKKKNERCGGVLYI